VEEAFSFELMTLWGEAREQVVQRRFEKALEIYKYIILMYPDEPQADEYAHAALAEIYLTLRNLDLCREHITRALTHDPQKPEYHYILGFLLTLRNEWQPSMREFELALVGRPEKPEYLRGLGWATFSSGDHARGLLFLNKALRLLPDDVDILTDLAVSYLGVGEFGLARKYTRLALKIDPESSLVRGTMWMVDYASHLAHMEED
jgi:tetratricopeptide (TPR) repeat protein